MFNKPFSQACENNKQPILNALLRYFDKTKTVLEIGSGTGQHASFFAPMLPQLTWQTSDLFTNHDGINAWLNDTKTNNLLAPIEVNLQVPWQWQAPTFNAIFTANTLHIISWPLVINLFEQAAVHLTDKGLLCIYGPFNYNGQYTSESNANFDLWLKDRSESSGIRDYEKIINLAELQQFTLVEDIAMPANNRFLIFTKSS